MISDFNYLSNVVKKVGSFILTTLVLLGILKLSCFYLPFLFSFLIAMMLEPVIKLFMNKIKLTRKLSSIIVMGIFIVILTLIIGWGISTLFSETNKLVDNADIYINKVQELFNNLSNSKLVNKIPNELKDLIFMSKDDILKTLLNTLNRFFELFKNFIMSIPNFFIILFFSLIALFFMCTDKIYMIDQIEHHLPDKWAKHFLLHLREIVRKLIKYLEAETILVVISFFVSLVGFWIFNLIGIKVQYPLLVALGIAFVDALPILGSGTAMVPWAIIEAINGNFSYGIAIIILFVIMMVVKNFLEPKLVSKHIGIHPVFTILAMYTGLKLIGITGLIVGPVLLIIIKEMYEPLIEKGIIRSLFDNDY